MLVANKMVGSSAYAQQHLYRHQQQQQQLLHQSSTKSSSPSSSSLSMADPEMTAYSDDDDSQYASYMDNDSILNSDDDDAYASASSPHSGAPQIAPNNGNSNNASKRAPNAVQRQPTRRPNPKIHNRNALMARENRKKKKEHVELLERDVDTLRHENETLRHQLAKCTKTVRRLRTDCQYLKSVIANQTSIMHLLKHIQGNKLRMTSSALSYCVAHDDDGDAADGHDARSASKRPRMMQPPPPQHDHNDNAYNNDCGSTWAPFGGMLTGDATAEAAALMLSDCASPLHDIELPAMSWEVDMGADVVFRPDDVFAIEPKQEIYSETDTVDEDDEKPSHSGATASDPAAPQPLQQIKVSHEHNYYNNHINEQSRTSSSSSTTTTTSSLRHETANNTAANAAVAVAANNAAAAAANDTNSMAEHLHRGGKVRPNASAAGPEPSAKAAATPGICLHLSGGRVSLEFCASCHMHAQNAWDEEDDDDDDEDAFVSM